MVHRGQAMLLAVVAGLAATIVGIVAMSGTGIPARVLARAGSVAAPATGIPSRITIGSAAPAAGASPAGTTRPGVGAPESPGTGSTTLVSPNVYTYPPDDRGRDGIPGPSPSAGSGGGSGDGGSGGHHG
ncbi:MAG TPA: hypothetical protein VE953_10910 [Terriglobales bacterium]|nr:hypothetical protein [Terriglobales bacterium]